MTEGRYPVEIGGVGLPLLVTDPVNRPNVYAIRESRVPTAGESAVEEQMYEYPGAWGGCGHRARILAGPFYERASGFDFRFGRLITTSPQFDFGDISPSANAGRIIGFFEQGGYRFAIGARGYSKFLGEEDLGFRAWSVYVRGAVLYDGEIHVGGVPGVDFISRLDTIAAGAPAGDTWTTSVTFAYTPLCVEPERLWVMSSAAGIRSLPYGQDAVAGGLYSGEFEIDDPDYRINAALSLGGQLIVGKEDGMYSFDEALVVRALTPKFRGYRGSNFDQMVEHDGAVWATSAVGPVRYAPGEADEAFLYNVLAEDSLSTGRCNGVCSVNRELYLNLDARVHRDDDSSDRTVARGELIVLREPDQGDRTFLPYVPHTVLLASQSASDNSYIAWEFDDYDSSFVAAALYFEEGGAGGGTPPRIRSFDTDSVSSGSALAASAEVDTDGVVVGDNYVVAITMIASAAAPTISAITYAGVAMTQSSAAVNGAGDRRIYVHYIRNPASSSGTVSITLSGAATDAFVTVFGVVGAGDDGVPTSFDSSSSSQSNDAAHGFGSQPGMTGLMLGAVIGHERQRMTVGQEEFWRFARGTVAGSVIVGGSVSGRLHRIDPWRMAICRPNSNVESIPLPGPDGRPESNPFYQYAFWSGSDAFAYLGVTDCGSPDERKLLSRVTIARVLEASAGRNLGIAVRLDPELPQEEGSGWLELRTRAGALRLEAPGAGLEMGPYGSVVTVPLTVSAHYFRTVEMRLRSDMGAGGVTETDGQVILPMRASFPIRLYYYLAGEVRRQFSFTVFFDAALSDEFSVLERRSQLVGMVGEVTTFFAEGFMRSVDNVIVNSVGELQLVVRQDPNSGLAEAGYSFDVVVTLFTPESQ